jgi:hypothetical protein
MVDKIGLVEDFIVPRKGREVWVIVKNGSTEADHLS